MVCLKCDHRRPKTAVVTKTSDQPGAKGGYHNRGNMEVKGSRSVGGDVQRQTEVQECGDS